MSTTNTVFPEAAIQAAAKAIIAGYASHQNKRCAEFIEGAANIIRDELSKAGFGFPDIGPDPLKLPPGEESKKRNSAEGAMKQLRDASDTQQGGVPDQTALVWRMDIIRVLMEMHWRGAQGRQFESAMSQLRDITAARDTYRGTVNRIGKLSGLAGMGFVPLAVERRVECLIEALKEFRDSVLRSRGPLEETVTEPGQVNAILTLFDETVGHFLPGEKQEEQSESVKGV